MEKPDIIDYLKSNEFDHARANASLICCDLAFKAYAESDRVHHVLYSPVFCYYGKRGGVDSFYQINAKKIISDIAKRIYLDYVDDPKTLDDAISAHMKLEHQLDDIWKEYLRLRGKNDIEKFVTLFKKYESVSEKWWYYGAIGEDKGALIQEVIVPKFAKRHDLELNEADEIFNTLSHPAEQTIFNIERENFLEICLDVATGTIPARKIKNYLRDFFWIKTDYFKAVELTTDSIIGLAKDELEKNGIESIKKELAAMRQSGELLRLRKKEYAEKIDLSPEDKKDIIFAEKTIQWIDVRKRGMMKDFYYLFVMVADFAKKGALSYEELAIYTTDEFLRFVKTGERISADEVGNRTLGAIFKYEKGLPREEFTGKDAQDMFDAFEQSFDSRRQVKGQVASTGGMKKVTGKVRIIHNPSEEEFNNGDILVTSMTRIEFVPLMRKAKAIITDEGGIACHAAIVSRELGLPCIIGTKVATRLLKNGDEVDIDLVQGTVVVIK